MNVYLGDFDVGATVRHIWATAGADGASITRATNGTISIYKDANTTQDTDGVTDIEDFDSLTGVHLCAVDMSADATFYSAGSDFTAVLSGATIDGKTVNAPLFSWSVGKRSHLRPTVAARTLDVSAAGNAGIDWANIENPTAVVALTGTTVDLVADAVDAAALAAGTSTEVITALMATVIETNGSITFGQALRIVVALLAGRTSGGTFKTPDNAATRAVITYTGNDRTGVTLTPDA